MKFNTFDYMFFTLAALLFLMFSMMLVFSTCQTPPNCAEVDCTECWDSWWLYDPITHKWYQTYRPCEGTNGN